MRAKRVDFVVTDQTDYIVTNTRTEARLLIGCVRRRASLA
ncbi:hypothetical protein LAB1_04600 [Roseibium sp. LAB1]